MGSIVSSPGAKAPEVGPDEVYLWNVVHRKDITELKLQNPKSNTKALKLPKELAQCPTVKKLDVEKNPYLVGSLDVLKTLPVLERFSARRSMLDGSINPLGSCANLEVFDISYSEVKGDVACLAGCSKLRRVIMQECNRITGSFEVFAKLEHIEEIIVDSCKGSLSGTLDPLKACKNLRVLMVALLVEGTLEPLAKCKELRKISLSRTKLRGNTKCLAVLTKLKEVKLEAHINLSGTLSICKGLEGLQRLFLGTTSGELGPLKYCPKLERLTIENTVGKLSGPLSAIKNLQELKQLTLSNCQYLDGTLEPIGNCALLEHLDLRGCLLLEGDLEPLSNCLELEYLNIDKCKNIVGTIEPISELANLRTVTGTDSGVSNIDSFTAHAKEPDSAVQTEIRGETWWRAVVASMQGWRPTLEDTQFMVAGKAAAEAGEADPYALFAVLDGHGGTQTAVDAAEVLPPKLETMVNGDPAILGGPHEALAARLKEAFISTEEAISATPDQRKKLAKSGATCTAVGLRRASNKDGGFEGWIANIGDSRALVVRTSADGTTVESILQSEDHKPLRPDERARIEAAGGYVSNIPEPEKSALMQKLVGKEKKRTARVDGNLAVSRGFGDLRFKSDQSRAADAQKVTCVPEVYDLVPAGGPKLKKGDYVMLACDAVFDEMDGDAFAAKILKLINAATKDPEGHYLADVASEFLSELLFEHHSMDNMTILIVEIGVDGSAYASDPKTKVFGSKKKLIKREQSANRDDDTFD